MELIMNYKEGSVMNEGNTLYLVLFKTLYNMVILEFKREMLTQPYSDWQAQLPIFTWKNYDLTNKDDIQNLNNKFQITTTNNLNKFPVVYGVEIGSVVEYDYKQMMLLGRTERKVLSFTLTRPILFDFNKAKEKYIVFDRLDKLNELQAEFNRDWEEYLITPFASEENIDWTVVRDKFPFEEIMSKEYIINEFVHLPTKDITLEDFYGVIDMKKLNLIPDGELKTEIFNLIKQTLLLAKKNGSIGSKSDSKKPTSVVEPINTNDDINAGKTLYKIDYVLKALEKDGGDEYPNTESFYAFSQQEAMDIAEESINRDIELSDLYLEAIKVTEISPPVVIDKEVSINKNKGTGKLSNLRKGDEFTFPLSQDDIQLGATDVVYVFDKKVKSTYFYREFGTSNEFSTSENRIIINFFPNIAEQKKTIEETDDLEDLLKLYE